MAHGRHDPIHLVAVGADRDARHGPLHRAKDGREGDIARIAPRADADEAHARRDA